MTITVDLIDILRDKLGDLRAEETLGLADAAAVTEYLDELARQSLGLVETYLTRNVSGAVETRTFTVQNPRLVYIDDHHTLTALKVDDTGDGTFSVDLTLGSYIPIESPPGVVIGYEVRRTSDRLFSVGRKTLEVTATFGWPNLPGALAEPILRLATNIFLQDQQNRRGRVVAVGDFDIQVRGSDVMTSDIRRDLGIYKRYAI